MARWNWLGILVIGAAVACGSGTNGSTSSSTGTTGGPSSSLPSGSPCTADNQCFSQICGVDGTGNCCTSKCTVDGTACGITRCDSTGTCAKAYAGANCDSCSGSTLTPGSCNGTGTCESGIPSACGGDLVCDSAGKACGTSCSASSDCASGSYCNAGLCAPKVAVGACSTNDACTSGICGIGGTGHCCSAACANTTAPCGATDCDVDGACVFPNSGTACGSVAGSCSGTTQNNPSVCDGQGNCPTPGTTDCSPFVCGPTACLSSCVDGTSCGSGDFCDTLNAACCAPLAHGDVLTVDSVAGNDSLGCCGIGSNPPCRTLTHAMRLINVTEATNVTIQATVNDGGGDWAPSGEKYPIVLGWGVELNAPGVYFWNPSGTGSLGTFRVSSYSSDDNVGYVSMVGTPTHQIGVGMNKAGNTQSTALSAIQIDSNQALYIANAYVNGNASAQTNAFTVEPAGTLVLGSDQAGAVTGTVNIGNGKNVQSTDGFDGIFCRTDNLSRGCNVMDAPLVGVNSVVIQGQESAAIVAQDFANLSLTAFPIIGVQPGGAGFGQCSWKPDGASLKYPGTIYLDGKVSMVLKNASIHCISADAIAMAGTYHGGPTLVMDKTTISNTETALSATAGTATVSNSTIQFNYNGVLQGQYATVDLSGGSDAGTNTIVCSSNSESIYGEFGLSGVNVLNQSQAALNAMDVAWDTAQPDQFSCKANLASCTCLLATCSEAAGDDGMDAVTEGGTVITAGNTLSTFAMQRGCR